MNNAYEYREEYSKDGKVTKRERTVGPVVVIAVIVIVAIIFDRTPIFPSGIWQLLK